MQVVENLDAREGRQPMRGAHAQQRERQTKPEEASRPSDEVSSIQIDIDLPERVYTNAEALNAPLLDRRGRSTWKDGVVHLSDVVHLLLHHGTPCRVHDRLRIHIFVRSFDWSEE